MKNMKKGFARILLYILVPVVLLGVLLTSTNPYHLPLAALIIPFGLLFIIVFQSSYLSLSMLHKKAGPKRLRLNAAIIAGGVFLMALLQSIRQLGVQDLIIIACLVAVLSFYVKRIDIS